MCHEYKYYGGKYKNEKDRSTAFRTCYGVLRLRLQPACSRHAMNRALQAGVAVAVALAMLRVLTGLSIYWVLVPGYAAALIMSRFVPPVFVGIAFDSGGVASGPMTSTFLLPLAMGACSAVGGNVVTDAFGIVALVALAPLIAIQIMGLLYARRTQAQTAPNILDDTVVELEEY